MLASSYPLLDVVWTLLVVFAWMLFFVMVVVLFVDVFRRADLSGWAKAAWALALFFIPFLGALLYLIVRPRIPNEDLRLSGAWQTAGAVGVGPSPADELVKLNDLRVQGAITETEFETLKQRTIAIT